VRLPAAVTVGVTALLLVVSGCAGSNDPAATGSADPAGSADSATHLKVGMSYDIGGRGDPFNDITAKGLDDAKDKLGITFKELEATVGEPDSQRESRLRLLAEGGYDPIIAVGFAYAAPLKAVAADYPDVHFAIVDDASVTAANITNLVFAEEQGSYLAGALAATASKTKHVGFVGGVDVPLIQKFQAGFDAGVASVDAGVKVEHTYLTQPPDFGGFNDPQKGSVAAKGMYDSGVDVVFHAAGASGAGVFAAAAKAGLTAIGCNTDEYATAPADEQPHILSSMLKRVDAAVFDYLESVQQGTPLEGVQTFDIARGGIGMATSNPDEKNYQDLVDGLSQQIVDGAITVPDSL
jgi:basic membrane protein A and related proteins